MIETIKNKEEISQSNTKEFIVLVDNNGVEIGKAEKHPSHHGNTPLHKAFSCYIFNREGKFLLTRRAASKKVWPGVWTNSVCGHPGPNEKNVDAIRRRLVEELGMTAEDYRIVLPNYRYKSPPFNGIVENEICPVYVAKLKSTSKINHSEVEEICWVDWYDFVNNAENDDGEVYSWWCKNQIKQLKNNYQIQNCITN